MQKIEGKQIYLRPITMEDTDRIVSWRNQDRVRHNFIYQKLFTKESHENWMHTQVETGHVVQFIICEKNNDRPVGSVYFRDIDHDNKKAEYGIFIGEADAAGRGIGSETARLAADYARDVLKLHKLMLRVFADNVGAVKSYQNAGFVQEAFLKDEFLQNGGEQINSRICGNTGGRLKNKLFQSRDLCLRALDTNSACAKSVRRNERKV